jgi:lysine decarboxylase
VNQASTPLATSLLRQADEAIIPFDVPGHKGNSSELIEFFGSRCIALDKNSRIDLDNLCQPTGVIKEAEDLAAEAFGSHAAFFMVGGTTSSVQAMIMSTCTNGDKIIVPRNVHASVINAIILSGAVPLYVNPSVHKQLGISLGMSLDDIKHCIEYNSDAKAVFINNPTYYGICSNLADIVALAHANDMLVLVDEAHGTHFSFHDDLPLSAMQCNADLSAVSMHKTGGSLTQSSLLLTNSSVDTEHIRTIINLSRTTSASYLLMASIDLARKKMALEGNAILDNLMNMVQSCRSHINAIGDYYAFADELLDGNAIYDFDTTKLCINTDNLGLAGIELYDILRLEYNIQLEFGDIKNVLAIASMGDKDKNFDVLLSALVDIKKRYKTTTRIPFEYEYVTPIVKLSPAKAFYAAKQKLPIESCEGRISGDYIMCYPPGIPILAPGELITREIIDHIKYSTEKGCAVTALGNTKPEILSVVSTS